ncbi:hypothetical protein OVA24_16745 [Luteolibacter sp. SL250]|uniref:hypothetical protein n=1 Tax=Luteolibacter sp. SL250 TaxID=2995170 RepID=UPI0022722988|nr:hypothetical protein [Luteolibacter sp. SL250]WAC18881.1 hypothetical protein OVA24_16745 [Luteolibacter sp. SL250]
MIRGLYHQCHRLRQRLNELLSVETDDPAEEASATERVPGVRIELAAVEAAVPRRLVTITMIEGLVSDLNRDPFKSADLTLAIRHLEDASMRLRRELGDTV